MDSSTLSAITFAFADYVNADLEVIGDSFDVQYGPNATDFLGIYYNGEQYQVGESFEYHSDPIDALFSAFVILGGSPEDFPNL